MMQKLGSLISLFVIAGLLSGCGTLRPRNGEEVDQAQIERNLYNVASSATQLAINKIYEDRDLSEKLIAAGKLEATITEFALPLLSNPEAEITEVLEGELLNLIPEEYRGLMAAAYETFYAHYEFPTTSEVLPEPYISYLRAFLTGVRDGAGQVLKQNNAHIDTLRTIHVEENNG